MDVTDQQVLKARAEKAIAEDNYVTCLCGELFFRTESYLEHYRRCPVVDRIAR